MTPQLRHMRARGEARLRIIWIEAFSWKINWQKKVDGAQALPRR
jgi:hypothetical protein